MKNIFNSKIISICFFNTILGKLYYIINNISNKYLKFLILIIIFSLIGLIFIDLSSTNEYIILDKVQTIDEILSIKDLSCGNINDDLIIDKKDLSYIKKSSLSIIDLKYIPSNNKYYYRNNINMFDRNL